MKLPRRNFLHLVAGVAALPAWSCVAWAQAYPARPVRIIVGAAPSGTYDIMARLIGEWLSERLGQPFVILPDVPTVGEFVHGYEASTWSGVGAPKATPAEILEKLNKELLTSGSGTSRDSNRAEHVFARAFQTSTCSAMASASSTSMPRWRTVLSNLDVPLEGTLPREGFGPLTHSGSRAADSAGTHNPLIQGCGGV